MFNRVKKCIHPEGRVWGCLRCLICYDVVYVRVLVFVLAVLHPWWARHFGGSVCCWAAQPWRAPQFVFLFVARLCCSPGERTDFGTFGFVSK